MDAFLKILQALVQLFTARPPQPPPVQHHPVQPPPDKQPLFDGQLVASIVSLARTSPVTRLSWKDRGVAPIGYITGMCVMLAVVYRKWKNNDPAAIVMARAVNETEENDRTDALSWYNSNFHAAGMSNDVSGADTLRHAFVLLMGLGMRESSGRYCEGYDRAVDVAKITAESAESGLFQMSWDAFPNSPGLLRLFKTYYQGAEGYLSIFQDGVHPTPKNLEVVGEEEGAAFQKLCKDAPAFAVEAAAYSLRTNGGNRGQWGPIRRKDVEIKPEVDALFKNVQRLVDGGDALARPPPPPDVRGTSSTHGGSVTTPAVMPTVASGKPPWFVASEGEIGFHEIGNNRGIEKYINGAKSGSVPALDGQPYCAIGVNWALETTGFHGSRSAMARSFEKSTDFVKLDGPAIGAIMTFWRGSPGSGSGHVTQYAGRHGNTVLGLGWNQSDGVNVAAQDMSRLTGYWWPKNYPLPKIGHVTFAGDAATHGSET